MKAAVVIPAQDEGAAIGQTVRQTLGSIPLGTPLWVIADRCTDDTSARAAEAGARAVTRTNGPAGKGAALAWFLEAHSADLADVEVLVILDADSRLQPGAVEALTGAVEAGAGAAQAFVRPVPSPGSAVSIWAAYSEWLSQAVGDRLRGCLRWPVPLRGTGMAVRVSLLRELAPRFRTQVEDAELSLLLAALGERIAFVPAAAVEDPKPSGAGGAMRQRARWLRGQGQLLRHHLGTILKSAFTRGPGMWSLVLTLLAKPKTFFILLKGAALSALWPWRDRPMGLAAMILFAALLAKDVLACGLGVFFAPRAWRGALVRCLAFAPFYFGVWLGAAVLGLFSRNAWLRARE